MQAIATPSSGAVRDAAEGPGHRRDLTRAFAVERVTRIELACPAWKTKRVGL
jgi:hypothetical protein